MKIYKISRIGQFHLNYNEDYHIIEEIETNKVLIAVMDGCSAGTDSHFASTLIGKFLRKIAKNNSYKEFASRKPSTLSQLLDKTSNELFTDLKSINHNLSLGYDELLSTLVLGIIDLSSAKGIFLIAGDGLIVNNGTIIEYEQGNKPDYIGYHLSNDFDSWYENHTQKLHLDNIHDLSIATDGVFTFRPYDNKPYPKCSEDKICKMLFEETNDLANSQMFTNQLLIIEQEYGLKPSDDLTIIRIILDN